MQKTLQSLSSVSFLFFVFFGGLHISTALLIAQGVVNPVDTIIFKSMDLPFLLSALLYGSAQLSLSLEEITGNLKIPFVICSSFSAVAFLGALYLNFGFPDATIF